MKIKEKNIKFKGSVLTLGTLVQNILKVYDQCDEHDLRNWYKEANDFANDLVWKYQSGKNFKTDLTKTCGVISALSPLKTWEENKRLAKLFMKTGKAKHTSLFKGKAEDIYNEAETVTEVINILSGNKISAFFLNILNPETSEVVTIDRHAISIALGRVATQQEKKLTLNQYKFFELAYRVAAAEVGIKPIRMQSATWCRWRKNIKVEIDYSDVPF